MAKGVECDALRNLDACRARRFVQPCVKPAVLAKPEKLSDSLQASRVRRQRGDDDGRQMHKARLAVFGFEHASPALREINARDLERKRLGEPTAGVKQEGEEKPELGVSRLRGGQRALACSGVSQNNLRVPRAPLGRFRPSAAPAAFRIADTGE
jgi:hypothetical protein